MKKTLLVSLIFVANNLISQVVTNGSVNNFWMGLNPLLGSSSINSVGFGATFAGPNSDPQSRFQISDFGWQLPANAAFTQGSLFRTDGNTNSLNRWQLFTGISASQSSEKFRLSIPANTANVLLNATDPSGNLQIQTGNTSRLFIQKSSATPAFGVNTAGFIGIGNSAPASPLHIQASQQANPLGWNRALTLSNNASLYFDGGTTNASLFLAHPSTNPLGNFYCGSASNLTSSASVDYAYSIHTTTAPAGSPLNSTTFFKNFFVTAGPATNVTILNERRLGVNTNTPQNVVEINTASTSAVPGNSGLRLTDLTSTSNVQSNPGSGVLSVNSNGDVIYVDKNSVGNYCGSVQNPLLNDFEIPLNNENFVFTDPNSVTSNNRVGIGLSAGNCTPSAKLHVQNQNYGIINSVAQGMILENYQSSTSTVQGLSVVNAPTTAYQSWGVYSLASGGTNSNIGVVGDASYSGQYNTGIIGGATQGTVLNTGVSASAQGPAPYNIGVGSFATNNPASNSGYNYGINSQATNGTNAIAGNFSAAQGVNNYGVYAQAPSSPTDYAGYFNGNVLVTGTATVLSDQMFKLNANKIPNALSMVKALNPKRYYLDTVQFNNRMSLSSKLQYGFIAQEVELTNPEIVGRGVHPAKLDSIGQVITPSFDYKTVNYNAIIPINTQAIKELNDKVDKATLSDASIKTNVQDLSASLQTILALRGVSFDWNHSVNQEIQLDSTNHIGFIAQEVQSIEPRLTFTGDNNLLHVDYNKVVPVLVEAIQEQNAIISHQDSMINELNNRLSNLENCINSLNLCNQNQPTQMAQPTTGQTISLNTVQSIVLNQNVPNPFAEQTVISFSIPESVKKADILFYDSNGKLINTVSIKERGNSQLNVFANDLSTGIYTYTLVADGQIVATKKMVKQ